MPLSPANTHTKLAQKSAEIHVKIKTTKSLEENMGINLHNPGLRANSSDTTPEASWQKKNELIKIKMVPTSKYNIKAAHGMGNIL